MAILPKPKKAKQLRPRIDRGILFTTLALILFGLLAVSSASSVISFERFGNTTYYFFRQLIATGVGLVVMYLASLIDYHLWKKWSRPILLGGLVLLALTFVPHIGSTAGTNAHSWLRFGVGGFLFQPSEFVKLALIFYLASWFERKKGAESNFWFGMLPLLLIIGAVVGAVVAEPDLGTAAIIGIIALVMLFAAGVNYKYIVGIILGAGGVFWLLIKIAPYRLSRIVTFLDPSLDPLGIGYHINQALLAIGSGGLWGSGFGASLQKHNYLPEPIGDSIFAVMAEELGFWRIMGVVLLFAVLIFRGLRLAKAAPDRFGQLAAIGIIGWIGLQTFVNIGAISGMLPLTGVPLPFVSYGGSSIVALSAAVGVLLNISKHRV